MTCLGCPDSSTLVGLQKLDGRLRYLAVFNNSAAQFVGNVDGYISAPSFSDIEGDDADRVAELALHQIADQRLAVSAVFVSLAPRSSELTKVFQHKVSVLLWPMGRNGWRGTHNHLLKPELSRLTEQVRADLALFEWSAAKIPSGRRASSRSRFVFSHRQRAQIVAIERQDIVMTTGEPFPDRKIAYRIGIRKCERFDFCGYHYGISEHTVGMRDTFEVRVAVAHTIAY